MIAIGNGGLTGKSQDEATQTHFKFYLFQLVILFSLT